MFCLQNHIPKTDMQISILRFSRKKYCFVRRTEKKLQKATKGTASVLQFIPTTFSSTSVTTPMTPYHPTVWDSIKFKFTCK